MIIAHVDENPASIRPLNSALANTEHNVAWSVTTGAEAIRRHQKSCVDVLLVSANVSDLSAAEITRQILAHGPCAVIVLADTAGIGISNVYDAMGAGAQDVVAPPRLDAKGRVTGAEALLGKLKIAMRLLGRSTSSTKMVSIAPPPPSASPLVAIGASTGGPQALLTVLSGLPKPFPAPILIVQHVDSEFTLGLATWLQDGSGVRVQLAKGGDAPLPGVAYLASSQDHLVIGAGGTLRYRAEPRDLAHRPSVDVLFGSLAEHWRTPGVAVLMTGMGRDGAEGMRKLRRAGWHTIAQDQASCVVYGMPKAAVLLDAVSQVLPLSDISGAVYESATRMRPRANQAAARER